MAESRRSSSSSSSSSCTVSKSFLAPPAKNRDLSSGSGTTPVTSGPQKLLLIQFSPCLVPQLTHTSSWLHVAVPLARGMRKHPSRARRTLRRGARRIVLLMSILGLFTSSNKHLLQVQVLARSFVARVMRRALAKANSPPRTGS